MRTESERPAGEDRQALIDHRQASGADDAMSVSRDHEAEHALDRARALWGTRAIVFQERMLDASGREHVTCFVGCQHDAFSWTALGHGRSWRDAFDAAEVAERWRR